ncbi:hypothetical protein KL86APRO_12035 [uncultured Alphaproteobacteria bacterium]|uniref:Uncharacterized protein n=1 Tax=uncultured Alphaproteobacteria bacterium TaxID=91750 RepID=A0A212K2G0_9PROT|nr:hypothetical protein KL86APRO_12035 [uncultured Alphaproteobacteria bacterium]
MEQILNMVLIEALYRHVNAMDGYSNEVVEPLRAILAMLPGLDLSPEARDTVARGLTRIIEAVEMRPDTPRKPVLTVVTAGGITAA